MPFSRTCERCGVAFEAQGSRAKFCSKSCKNAVGYARRTGQELAQVRAQPKRQADSCPTCGGSLEGLRPHAVYCSRACKNVVANTRRYGREPRRDQRRANNRTPEVRFTVSERDLRRLLHRYGHACAYCFRSGRLDFDHVLPLSRGGSHGIGNLLPACRSCNLSKNGSTVMEWRLRIHRKGVISSS